MKGKAGFVQILLDPNGYQMSFSKKSFGRKFYYCKFKDELGCTARLSVEEQSGMIVRWVPDHCHDNDLGKQMANKMVAEEVRVSAQNPLINPRTAHQKLTTTMKSDKKLANAVPYIPDLTSLAKKIQYERRKSFKLPPVPLDCYVELPAEFKITSDGLDFLIGDNEVPGRSVGKVLSFCSPTGRSLLANADEIFGDGTFEITSCTKFSQLWIACVRVKGITLPCFYSFLPTKESVCYRVMFNHLKLAIGDTIPLVFHVDFELAVMNSVQEAFPETRLQGCLVHFKRSLRRKISQLQLASCVDKDLVVQEWFRKVWALQLVAPLDAIYVWDNFIKTTVPYEEDEDIIAEDPVRVDNFNAALDQFVAYMESTWLGTPRPQDERRKPRYAIDHWSINVSVLEGTEFSTNCSESYNSVSKLSVVSKPSFWQVIIQLKAEEASARAKLMAIRTGNWKDKNPARTARRKLKKAALKSLVEDYYTMNPEEFLKAAVVFYNEF